MIGKLTGIVDSFYEDYLILDVSGVGYRVFCSSKTMGKMPTTGGTASLWIETQVREDHIHLIGFADTVEQQMFNLLSTVTKRTPSLGPTPLARVKALPSAAITAI